MGPRFAGVVGVVENTFHFAFWIAIVAWLSMTAGVAARATRLMRRRHLMTALNRIRCYDPIVLIVSNLDSHRGAASYALDWRANHLP